MKTTGKIVSFAVLAAIAIGIIIFMKHEDKIGLSEEGYIGKSEILEHIDEYIVEPGLGTASGATGALLLAKKAYERSLNA